MFSIIVSIYKVEKYLRQCIESILKQTYTDFELLLIDDGSPDECGRICDEYAKSDARVRIIHKENGGLMSTRKIGVSLARGEYVCFIDGDDFIREDMLKTYADVLLTHKADVICAGYTEYYTENGKETEAKQNIPAGFYDKKSLMEKVYPRMLSTEPFFSFYIIPSVCTKCLKLEIIRDIYKSIPENITLGEDAAASYEAILHAGAVSVIDYCGYYYRQNMSSITNAYDRRLYERVGNLLDHLEKVNQRCGWNAGKQLDEYTLFMLSLIRKNEMIFNKEDGYFAKRRNLIRYLKDDKFSGALKRVKMAGMKERIVHACLKLRLILPLQIWSMLKK